MATFMVLLLNENSPSKFVLGRENQGFVFGNSIGFDPFGDLLQEERSDPIKVCFEKKWTNACILTRVASGESIIRATMEVNSLNRLLREADCDPVDFYLSLLPRYPSEWRAKDQWKPKKKANETGDGFEAEAGDAANTRGTNRDSGGGSAKPSGGDSQSSQTGANGASTSGNGSGAGAGGGSGGKGGRSDDEDDDFRRKKHQQAKKKALKRKKQTKEHKKAKKAKRISLEEMTLSPVAESTPVKRKGAKTSDEKNSSPAPHIEEEMVEEEEEGRRNVFATSADTENGNENHDAANVFATPLDKTTSDNGSKNDEEAPHDEEEDEEAPYKEKKDKNIDGSGKKKERKTEIFRISQKFLTCKNNMDSAAVGIEKNLYKYASNNHEESTRQRGSLGKELAEVKVMLLALCQAHDKMFEVVRKLGTESCVDGVDKMQQDLKLPWKTTADMIYFIKNHHRELVVYCNSVCPHDEPQYVAKLTCKLLDIEYRKTILFTAPHAGGAGERQVKMGIEFTKIPTDFATFMYERINHNKYLPSKKVEKKKLARMFENMTRRLRCEEIARLFIQAVDKTGPPSDVCTILIANDLSKNIGGITERRPDLTDNEECKAWLSRHHLPTLRKIADSVGKSHLEMENMSNHDVINSCLRTKQTMAQLRRNAEKLASGEPIEDVFTKE